MKEYKETRHTLLYNSVSDLSFYCAGYEKCKPDWKYGPICRSYQLIHFVIEGRGELHIDDQVFELSLGDAFIIPAGKVAYYQAAHNQPWSYAWVSYLGINSDLYTKQLISSADKYILHQLDVQKYKNLILDIIALQNNSTSQYFKANSLLLNIVSHLFEDISFNEEEWGTGSIVDEVKFYIDMNFNKNVKIKDIAKKFGIHPNYLTRIFNNKFDVSPKHYLLNLKLNKACRLLATTNLSISLISSSLGFDDSLAFSKLFKAHYSIPPSEYRNTYYLDDNKQ